MPDTAIWAGLPGLDDCARACGMDIGRDLARLLGHTALGPEVRTVADAFVAAGLATSRADVVRLLRGGARLEVSGVRVMHPKALMEGFPQDRGRWVLRRGNAQARVVTRAVAEPARAAVRDEVCPQCGGAITLDGVASRG